MASTPLLTREQIGLRPPRPTALLPRAEGLTAHYWGPTPWSGADTSSAARFYATTNHNRCASIWRAAQSFHMSPGWGGTVNGGADIAYSSGVCPHGVRFEGRGPGKRTGAQGTNAGNSRSYATCYIAGDNDPITPQAMLAFLDEAQRLGGWSKPRWEHADWKATACAGPSIRRWKHQGWPRPGGPPAKPPTSPPVKPPPVKLPPTGGLSMSDIKTILARLDRIERNMSRKSIAFRDPRDKKIWVVTPDGTRHHLPNPGHKAVNLLAFIGVLQPGGERWVHSISAEHLDLIPKSEPYVSGDVVGTVAGKTTAFRDPRDRSIWAVGPEGTRHPLPDESAINLLAFIGVLRRNKDGSWIHPISAEHLDLIPKAKS